MTFTLTVTGRGGTDGIETATDTARVTATQNITNNPPVFAGGTVQARTFDETIGDATVGTAADIGTPVSATDPDSGDRLDLRPAEGTDRDEVHLRHLKRADPDQGRGELRLRGKDELLGDGGR